MQLRDYVHVKDAAEASLLALESNSVDSEAFNVGGSKAITVLEYTNLLMSIMGKKIRPQFCGEFRFGDTRHSISDISKLEKLGWEPQISLERTIEDYLNWIKTQGGVTEHYTEAEKVMKEQGVIR